MSFITIQTKEQEQQIREILAKLIALLDAAHITVSNANIVISDIKEVTDKLKQVLK